MAERQRTLAFDGWLEQHGLHVEVDRPVPYDGRAGFLGCRSTPLDTPTQRVHVMSWRRGGEIRSYVLVDTELRLMWPCYSGRWVEMDEAVARRLGATVPPYRVEAGGRVVERREFEREEQGR